MQVTYNGVTIPFTRTVRADSATAPTPEGGGDVLYVEHSYQWEGVLTPDVPGLVLPGETFASAVGRVRLLLQQPRKPLYISMDGLYLRVDAGVDVKNGPLPELVQLFHLAGTQACGIRWGVRCHTPVCESRGVVPQWVAHRWRERLSIDQQTWAKTWTRTGTLHIRPGPWSADAFRGMVTPPIRAGFLRVRPPEYELAEDGLSLRYTVTDEEQFAMPPAGAVSADGHCDVSANMGMYQFAEVSVRLTGSIVADKYRLLQLATVIAVQKIEDMGGSRDDKTNKVLILQGALRTRLYKNEVEVYFRARVAPQVGTTAKINDFGRFVGAIAAAPIADASNRLLGPGKSKPGDTPPPGETFVPKVFDPAKGLTRLPAGFASDPPDPGTGGEGVALLSAALQDPCLAPPTPGVGGWGRTVSDPNATGAGSDLPKSDPKQEKELKGGRAAGAVDAGGGPGGQRAAASQPVAVAGSTPFAADVPELVVPEAPPGFMWPTPSFSTISRADFDAGEADDGPRPTLSALYTDYHLRQRVKRTSGLVGRGEQRAGGLTRAVQVSSPSMTIMLDYVGTRAGGKVAAPDVSGWGSNYFVIEQEDDGDGVIEIAEDGVTLVNQRRGTILIGVVDPSKAVLNATIAPWVAELLGRDPEPLAGPDGPPADPDGFRKWRDQAGGGGELRTG